MKRLQARRGSVLMAAASFALVVLAACGGSGGEPLPKDVTRVPTMSDAAAQATREAPPPGATPEGGAEAAAAGATTPAAGGETAAAMSVEVVSHDIYFDPAELTIPANTDVTFNLPNQGVTLHDFSIDELGINVSIQPGATEQVVINAPPGTYEYYCNVPGHKAAGMVGTLTVSAEAAAAPAAGETAATPAGEASPAAVEAAPAAAEATPVEAQAAAPAAAAQPVEVVSHDIYFEPKEVTIPADTDVTFTLPNEGVTLHNFAIDALGVDVDLAPGETKEVVINAPEGEYEFYCNVPGHKEAGMVGTLIVSAEASAAPAGATAAEGTPAAASPAPAPAEATPQGAATPAAAAGPFEIAAEDIFFEPDEITIPANTDVTVTVPNKGVTLHNFSIDALGIDVDLTPGETQEVVINAPAGEYEFYCNVPGHKAAGMVGTLTVTGDAGAAPAAAGTAAAQEAAATPPASPEAAPESAPAAAAEPVEVVSHDIYFEPKEVTIPADTDVTFTLPNDGVTLHNFAIDELGIDVDLAPGETNEVVINAPAGTYEFYCNVPGHKEAGMVGTLTVE